MPGRYPVVDGEAAQIAALRRGDAGAFDAVYGQHRDRIYGFLVRMTGRRDVADDLFQETWLRLARSAPELREDSNLKAWLFTVARNLIRSHARWVALDREAVDRVALDATPIAPSSPYQAVELGETQAALERALARLRPIYREALILVAVEGMSPMEAAGVADITPEAMRQRLARARAELVEALEDRDRKRKAQR